MRWFLLCLARYSAAQKALEPCEANYTHNTPLPIYVYFEYACTAYVALPPEAKFLQFGTPLTERVFCR